MPATRFDSNSQFIYLQEGKDSKQQVIDQLSKRNIIRNTGLFSFTATKLGVWEKLKPGRFEIKKGESIFSILRMLRNNRQSPVKLIINKLRTHEDLARLIAKNFLRDSITVISFLSNNDSLQPLDVDTNTLMSLIIPDTYFFNWNTSLKNILIKLKNNEEKFWEKDERKKKAEMLGLTQLQVYIIASIIEEETNYNNEKGLIASVYINRLNKGMPLGADPAIKFALRDFGLKRILYEHINACANSPYNTYRNKGLPPGPICTPSAETISAVLDGPKTDYLFFVAKSDFSGYHHFSTNFAEHIQYAREYQRALDTLLMNKANQNK